MELSISFEHGKGKQESSALTTRLLLWTFELLTDLGGSTWRDTTFLYNFFLIMALYYLSIWRWYLLFPYKKLLIGIIENQGYCGFLNPLEVAPCSVSLFSSQSWSSLRIYWPSPSVYFFQPWPPHCQK